MRYDLLTTIVVAMLMVALALVMLERQPSPPAPAPATEPHPRVVQAVRRTATPSAEIAVDGEVLHATQSIDDLSAEWWASDGDAGVEAVQLEPVSTPTPSAEPTVARTAEPEPTPAPEPRHVGALTRDEVRAAARAAGWPESQIETVVRVAECESGLRPWEVGAAGEVGVLQIHPIHRELHAKYDLRDPVQNMAAGLEVWQGAGWSAWSCS